jgi:DNA-binding transcriptional LysR family regulator
MGDKIPLAARLVKMKGAVVRSPMPFDGRILNGIGVLAAVVETKSFNRAAGALGITASGVSRAIARLEERVGVRLFQRTARSVTLTEEGRRFYESVAPLMQGIEDAAGEAAGARAEAKGTLRVAVDSLVARVIVGPNVGPLLRDHPSLRVDLVVRERLGDLVTDGFDCAVRFGDPVLSGLVARKIAETRVVTCASPAYVAARGRPAHPRELAKHECIHFRDPATGRPYDWIFVRKAETIRVAAAGRLVINDAATGLAACAAGVGIAQKLAVELHAHPELDLVDLFPDWPDERFPLYLYLPSRRQPPAKVRVFIEFIAAVCKPPAKVRRRTRA